MFKLINLKLLSFALRSPIHESKISFFGSESLNLGEHRSDPHGTSQLRGMTPFKGTLYRHIGLLTIVFLRSIYTPNI